MILPDIQAAQIMGANKNSRCDIFLVIGHLLMAQKWPKYGHFRHLFTFQATFFSLETFIQELRAGESKEHHTRKDK